MANKRRPWTAEEDAQLGSDIAPVVAERLARTTAAVRRRRNILGIRSVRAERFCKRCSVSLAAEDPRSGAPKQYCEDCVAESIRAAQRAYYRRNISARQATTRRSRLKRQFGITPEDYDLMLAAQAGGCALCGAIESDSYKDRRFYVDHDHASGAIRGLLCGPCNLGIGQLKDDPCLLRAAAEYIERNRLRLVGGDQAG